MSKTRKIILITVVSVLLVVMALCGYKLYTILHEYKVAEEMYNQLGSQFVSARDEATVTSPPAADGKDEADVEYIDPEISPISVDFTSLLNTNEDVCAWIYSPGTIINYPVVKGEDNSYYAHRFLDGSWNSSGTIYLNCLCSKDFSGENSIIYGHHMNDESMFATLCNYHTDENYFSQHPKLYLSTPTANYRIDIFAGFVTPANSETFTIAFLDETDFDEYVEKSISQSDFKTDIEVEYGDELITLTTCIYDYDDARYVIQGKLVKIH